MSDEDERVGHGACTWRVQSRYGTVAAPTHARLPGRSGAKADRWLVRTVAGLTIGKGLVQVMAPGADDRVAQARLLGLTTAGTLLTVDLYYGLVGRISRMYLLDAAVEAAWLTGWAMAEPPRQAYSR